MTQSPVEILSTALNKGRNSEISDLLPALAEDSVQDLRIIVSNGESLKAVLGVTLTSIVYKILNPSQDIRYHQDQLENGYSGRTFDTKYVTPFLKENFPHIAMAESAWLTRSLEQTHPYNFEYPGNIRNKKVKAAFLNTLNRLQSDHKLAFDMLTIIFSLLLEALQDEEPLFTTVEVSKRLTISKIIEAVNLHINHNYRTGTVGTARIPVLAIYSVYNLILPDVKRYSEKKLAPLE